MTYLVDTDWVVDYLKGRVEAITLLDQLLPDGLAISTMTLAEAYEGIQRGADVFRQEQALQRWLPGVDIIVVDHAIAKRFGALRADLRARGEDLYVPDILIAATVIEHNLVLVTRNIRHFSRIPDLKLYRSS